MGFKKSKKKNRLYGTGENHKRWLGGDRGARNCQQCGSKFFKRKTQSITVFWKQKFCSKECADKGGFRFQGKEHPNYHPEARRRSRGGAHHQWVNAVVSRDKATCQKCGTQNVELHAHHIKSYRDHPELRFDVSNGITLCFRCHWETHTALNAKAVNSVKTRQGNTEPSSQGNLLEGVTTRGRAYRKWVGRCDFCGTTIVKRLSDAKGKPNLFCGGSCRSKWIRKKHGPIPHGSKASTSPAPERDEIV